MAHHDTQAHRYSWLLSMQPSLSMQPGVCKQPGVCMQPGTATLWTAVLQNVRGFTPSIGNIAQAPLFV